MVRCSIPCFTEFLIPYTSLQFSEAIVVNSLLKCIVFETQNAYLFIRDNFKVLDISKKSLDTFVVQLASDQPDDIFKAIKLVYESTNGQVNKFNLNAGCNMPWTQKRFGSWLIKNNTIKEVVKDTVQLIYDSKYPIQFSVKTRLINNKVESLNTFQYILNQLTRLEHNQNNLLIIHMRDINADRKNDEIDINLTKRILKDLEQKYIDKISYNGDLNTLEQIQKLKFELNDIGVNIKNEQIMRSRGSLSLPKIQSVDINNQKQYIDNIILDIMNIYEEKYKLIEIDSIKLKYNNQKYEYDINKIFEQLKRIIENDVRQLFSFMIKEFLIQFEQQRKILKNYLHILSSYGIYKLKSYIQENM